MKRGDGKSRDESTKAGEDSMKVPIEDNTPEQELDEDEFLEVHRMKLDTLVYKIMDGEIKDAKTVAAVFKLKEYLKNDIS